MLRTLMLAAGAALVFSSIAFAGDAGGALHYLKPGQVDLSKVLPSPPEPNSSAARRDLAISLSYQRRRTPEMIALAQADQDRSIFRFGVIFGDRFTAPFLPKTAVLFDNALSDERIVGAEAKKFWSRPRPFAASTLVRDEPPTDSYPSNHATTAMLYARILARMLPEQSRRIFARVAQYAKNRVICGVHYQSDIEAGERAGAVEAQAMFENPEFRRDFTAARLEIRNALLARP
jgi:acid phosphatase (class A)